MLAFALVSTVYVSVSVAVTVFPASSFAVTLASIVLLLSACKSEPLTSIEKVKSKATVPV